MSTALDAERGDDLAAWLSPSRTALCVIDIQHDFAAPDGMMAGYGVDMSAVPAAIEKSRTLIEAARKAGVPVIFIGLGTSPETDSPAWKEWMSRRGQDADGSSAICRIGSPGAAFYGVTPEPGDEIVLKPKYSAFHATGFDELLKRNGIDTLLVCGLTTECCVDCTVRDAFHRDYHVFIAEDACAAYGAEVHESALAALEMNCAILMAAEEATAAWDKVKSERR